MLDEVQPWVAGIIERTGVGERIVRGDVCHVPAAALHRLEDQQIARHVLVDQIERKQRMAQVIQHADEQHDIELLSQHADVIDRQSAELDVQPVDIGGEPSLCQIVFVEIDSQHTIGAAPLHLQRKESAIAADVQHRPAAQIMRNGVCIAAPLDVGVIAQEMVRRGPHAHQLHVVKPGAQSG